MVERITSSRVETIRQQLSPMMNEIINHIETIRLLSTGQILDLSGQRSPSQARSVRRSLSTLTSWRVVGRLERRVGGRQRGSDGYVYALDVVGQRLIDPQPRRQWRRPWTPTPRVLDHALAGSQFYTDLRIAERSGQLELIDYQAEPGCWQDFTLPGGGPGQLRPDGLAVIGLGEFEHHWMIEIDRATESLPWIKTKAQTYQDYQQSGSYQNRFGLFPLVIWLTPTEQRTKALQELFERTSGIDPRIHRALTQDQAITQLLEAFSNQP